MREIITIHIGQAGTNVGDACWELMCLDHGVSPDGQIIPSARVEGALDTFFSETVGGKQVPRAVFIDLEPNAIHEVRTGARRELFRPDQLISGTEDASNNFSRGYVMCGKAVLDRCLDQIRKQADLCSDLQGFVITHSLNGGTGSGFSVLLLQALAKEFTKTTNLNFCVFPSLGTARVVLEPYNFVLGTSCLLEHTAATFVLENEAIAGICKRALEIARPSYANINRLIAQIAVNSLSLDGNLDLAALARHLVPFPSTKFVLSSYAPLLPADKVYYEQLGVAQIIDAAFDPANTMAHFNPNSDSRYLSCCLFYRGDVAQQDVSAAVADQRTMRTIQFVDWCPTGLKCGINSRPPTIVPGGELAKVPRTVCMLANNTAISSTFAAHNHTFDLLFAKRAFVHWYVGEGLEEGEMQEARENLAELEHDLFDIAQPPPETQEGETQDVHGPHTAQDTHGTNAAQQAQDPH